MPSHDIPSPSEVSPKPARQEALAAPLPPSNTYPIARLSKSTFASFADFHIRLIVFPIRGRWRECARYRLGVEMHEGQAHDLRTRRTLSRVYEAEELVLVLCRHGEGKEEGLLAWGKWELGPCWRL
jgi:hypothetical protein